MLLKLIRAQLQRILQFPTSQLVDRLEQQQHSHLERLNRNQIRSTQVTQLQLRLAQMMQPRELPPAKMIVVKILEHLNGTFELLRQRERSNRRLPERPRTRLQYVDAERHSQFDVVPLEERAEFVVQIGADGHVGEHSVELVCEFVTARLFQSIYHRLLRVHALALLVDEPFGEHSAVELLKDVLVVDVFEYGDALRETFFDFGFAHAFAAFLKQPVAVFG